MLNEIRNPHNNDYIARLNIKIREFNQLVEKNVSRTLPLILLQEINQIHMEIKRLIVDFPYKMGNFYPGFSDFEGIGKALTHFNLPNVNDEMGDTILMRHLHSRVGLPTKDQWLEMFTGSGFTRYFYNPTAQAGELIKDIQSLNDKKMALEHTSSIESLRDYFYALQSFKQLVLNKLSFELINETDLTSFRSLLLRVNGEINETQALLPDLKDKQTFAERIATEDIYQQLSQLSSDKMNSLILMLRNQGAINPGPPFREDMIALLPALSAFNIQKLGGVNNVNWKISNPETGLEFVFQVGEPGENQAIRHHLEHSPVNDYFSHAFFTSALNENTPFSLMLTEFCSGGDLRAERARNASQTSKEDVLRLGSTRLNQLTAFCQSCVEQHVAHPDIKLTNFLINHRGQMMIADKKAFIEMNQDDSLPSTALTTVVYEPPEVRNRQPNVNAEAFMTFQLGLAYYDYILLPELSADVMATPWSYQLPLDFTHSIFVTPTGQEVKSLILKMTDPDPVKRPPLKEVQRQLAQLCAALAVHSNTQSPHPPTRHAAKDNFMSYKERFTALRSQSLESVILADLKNKIECCSSLDELRKLQTDFTQSDEFQVLNKSQSPGLLKFFVNTAAVNAVNEMFLSQKAKLNAAFSAHM